MNNDLFLSLALQSLLQNTPDMLFFKDTSLVYRGGSEPFAKMVGAANVKSVIGKSDFEILPIELAMEYTEDDKKVFRSGLPIIDKIEPLTDLNGKKRYSSTSKFLIQDENNNVVGLCGYARDVTAQVTILEEIEQRELANEMFDTVVEADLTENRLIRVDGKDIIAQLELSECATFSDAITVIGEQYIHADHLAAFYENYSVSKLFSDFANGIKRFSSTVLQLSGGTDYRWTTISARIYFSSFSGTLRLGMFFTDIDDESRSRELLSETAQKDSLTGLLNRNSAISRITAYLASCDSGSSHALLFLDIDCFKNINDNFGHLVGDKVLIHTAQSLKALFGKDNIVGRVGGDEFMVLLKNVDAAQAHAFASSALEALQQSAIDDAHRVSCSVGISLYYGDDKAFDTLYKEADIAMYRAKKSGKNCACIYE